MNEYQASELHRAHAENIEPGISALESVLCACMEQKLVFNVAIAQLVERLTSDKEVPISNPGE